MTPGSSDGAATVERTPIDRRVLVDRHAVVQESWDPTSPVSVGNGEFAFTVDLTGLQSFPEQYPVEGENGEAPGTLLGTQAQWGWHSIPPTVLPALEQSLVEYATPHGSVPYVDLDLEADAGSEVAVNQAWLRANPHRLDLARIGFCILSESRASPLSRTDVQSPRQTLDLWHGIINSRFTLQGHLVEVETACHPRTDTVAVSARSAAFSAGLGILARFPYGSAEWHNAADWESPEAHSTALVQTGPEEWVVRRVLDDTEYSLVIAGPDLVVELDPQHQVRVGTTAEALDVTFHFVDGAATQEPENRAPHRGDAHAVITDTRSHWPRFWSSGGAVQLHESADPRALELERRIVLSQYLTAVNCAGSTPPQETGLVCNSWRGRFHLEMHWWHGAHFAQWNRPELLAPSLRWYGSILHTARATAASQGFDGVRWPKQVSPDGRESPSHIGPFLIWQQPHPIYLAELMYRADPSREVLEEYEEIVYETARFMTAFAHRTDHGFELGPPLIPAQESYASRRAEVRNPPFELAYWQWALRVACSWRRRSGRDPVADWEEVAAGLVAPRVLDGKYTAIADPPYRVREDHPSMLCAFGFLPATELMDPAVMRATLADVLADWDWDTTWGWDYAVIAMTAARLNDPDVAVDALLMQAPKNTFLPNGHNHQHAALPLYLPGNGGLLSAVALMAAGWEGSPDSHAPGFPAGWSVQWESLVPAP